MEHAGMLSPELETKTQPSGWSARLSEWNARHPILAIVVVSLVAVVINCHPVIFRGRSYVSPACMGTMVYSWQPGFPGMKENPELSPHGSDVASTMIQQVPAGYYEYRSLFEQGEWPLWNRYSHAGQPFLGQSTTMLGDPLQWIVILGRGSAIAWDLKFIVAKFLFCAGFGLLVRRIIGGQGLALLYAALAAWCGAFFFIYNHPVFFVFVYAPWILLSALKFLHPQERHGFGWRMVWLAVNFGCFNAGHLEVAVILIGGLNLAALSYALYLGHRADGIGPVLERIVLNTLLFLGLTAPFWASFLVALDGAYSVHAKIRVFQIPWQLAAGAFDDLFYQLCLPADGSATALSPGTSLLVLTGCLLSVFRWRQMRRDPFFWINCLAIGLWGGLIFGWIPASVLARIPFLNRDGHTHVDFSFVLVIHLTLQSAYGFRALAQENNLRRTLAEFVWIALIFAGLMAAYRFRLWQQPVPWGYFLCVTLGALGAPLVYALAKHRGARLAASTWAVILLLGFAAQFRFGIYGLGDSNWLYVVGPRLQLDTPSPALAHLPKAANEPFRVVGLQQNLYGDYGMVYRLEGIASSQPIANPELISLIKDFPGILFNGWIIEVKSPRAAQPLLNLLNVKYLLAEPDILLPEGVAYRLVDKEDFGVVENLEAWPRAFFTDEVFPVASNEEFVKKLLEHGSHPFAALSPRDIQALPESALWQGKSTVVPATNYLPRVNATGFDVHAPSAGMVCLTEGQARDFVATANGEVKPVLTVNRAFKGVYLDRPGDYHIEFTYRPRYWRQACWLFWLTMGGVAVLAISPTSRFFRRRTSGLQTLRTSIL